MPIDSLEMVLVPDDELQLLAEQKGPASAEAQALAQLKASAYKTCKCTVSAWAIAMSLDQCPMLSSLRASTANSLTR
jgi:hypothetical protein